MTLNRHRLYIFWIVLFSCLGTPLWAQDDDGTIPVVADVKVDLSGVEETGRFTLKIEFTATADIADTYGIRLSFRSGRHLLFRRDHAPKIPSKTWKEDSVITYDLPCKFPTDTGLGATDSVVVHLGFRNVKTGRTYGPQGSFANRDGEALVADFMVPQFETLNDEEALAATLAKAAEMSRTKRKPEAWDLLENALRRAVEDEIKIKVRDALVKVGSFKPRPLNAVEEQIVKRRIEEEKLRYFRLTAGRMYDRGEYHGALRIIRAIGGRLAEASGEAVMGAVDDANRAERDRQDTKQKVLEKISKADEAQAVADRKACEDDENKLFKTAQKYHAKRRYALARALLRELRLSDDREMRARAYALLEKTEKLYLEEIPPAETAKVKAALDHPVWQRTTTRLTNNFILIGPQNMLANIDKKAVLNFDLAYIFITDLFGRVPNPNGDRVTVYFKELWDFGGGVGGGKIINVGKAQPDAKRYPLDGALLLHEFTHCVDDTTPVYGGFREGLADFGATFGLEMIGNANAAASRDKSHRRAFERDYLARDLEYFRIQNYAPSAGFFMHFVNRYSKTKGKRNWRPYRKFFREYRAAPVRDGREAGTVRMLCYFLTRAFGDKVFDDLCRFRFPLKPSDRDIMTKELAAFVDDDFNAFEDVEALEKFPNSPLPRDRLVKGLEEIARRHPQPREEARQYAEEYLGTIFDWKVIGPFRRRGSNPDAAIFAPEYEIDFSKQYRNGSSICQWKEPGVKETDSVRIGGRGNLQFDYPYQDNTAVYALTNVKVEQPEKVMLRILCDTSVSVWHNDILVGKYENRGRNGSTWLWWRAPAAPSADDIAFPVTLRPGRNKLLLKMRIRSGKPRLALALTRANGTAFRGGIHDCDEPESFPPTVVKKGEWLKGIAQKFRGRSIGSKFKVKVGRFTVRDGTLIGEERNRRVPWRKYTVRPGFPKDAPSNLFWLKNKYTRDLRDFQLNLHLKTFRNNAPKVALSFQGEGEEDGLSGMTLVLHGSTNNFKARLERYDRLVYEAGPIKLKTNAQNEYRARIEVIESRCNVWINEQKLMDNRSFRDIPGKSALGVMTWGPNTGITKFEIRPRR